MKILFLIPPSEGKNSEWNSGNESLTYSFHKPADIAKNVTERDLKCIGNRFQEWVTLNTQLVNGENENVAYATYRYTGVMFNAIDYIGMSYQGQIYFENHFMIFSGMYGIVKPNDMIGNYKLPIDTKGLVKYWKKDITKALNDSWVEYVVNLLPLSYMKMIDFKILIPKVVHINFQTEKYGKVVKVSHGVKKIKWEWIKDICETLGVNWGKEVFKIFGWKQINTGKIIEINILNK